MDKFQSLCYYWSKSFHSPVSFRVRSIDVVRSLFVRFVTASFKTRKIFKLYCYGTDWNSFKYNVTTGVKSFHSPVSFRLTLFNQPMIVHFTDHRLESIIKKKSSQLPLFLSKTHQSLSPPDTYSTSHFFSQSLFPPITFSTSDKLEK